jgi:hypothetical protein
MPRPVLLAPRVHRIADSTSDNTSDNTSDKAAGSTSDNTPDPDRAASPRTTQASRCASGRGWLLVAALGIGLTPGLGCDRNIEAYQPGEESSEPDLAHIFPAPAGDLGSAEEAETATAATGQPARQALPPSRAEAAPPTAAAAPIAEPITGRIGISPELAAARPADGILFVIARPAGARGGPPLAVVRIADPSFPLDFTIGPEHVMIPSMQFAGSISLSARLDADGNAMTRAAEDLSSPVAEGLAPGSTGVELVLSERG